MSWSDVVRWTSRAEPATPLALVRVATGATLVWMYVEMLRRGLVDVLWVDRAYGGVRDLPSGNWLLATLGGPTPAVMHGMTWAALVACALLTVGLGGRVTAFVALQATAATTDINTHAGGSYDELAQNALWLLVLGPSTATLSLDCKLRTGSFTDATPVWAGARYLLLFQLVLMYWTTGLQKVSYHWVPGGSFDALYYIFQQPTWQRFDMRWVAWLYPLTQVGTAASWFWEVTAPLWLVAHWFRLTRTRAGWFRAWSNSVDLRAIYAIVGLVFHVAIFAFMEVGPFSPLSLAYYFAAFDHEEYAAWWRRLSPAGPSRTAR